MGHVGREVAAHALGLGQLLVLGPQGALLGIDAREERLHLGVGRRMKGLAHAQIVEGPHEAAREHSREHEHQGHSHEQRGHHRHEEVVEQQRHKGLARLRQAHHHAIA